MGAAWILKTLLVAVAMSPAWAQDSAGPPKFEVASVRISKALPPQPAVGVRNDEMPPPPPPPFSIRTAPQSLTVLSASLMECLTWSHQIRRWQISGPDWIEGQRYDIVAKTGAPADEAQMRRMLQTLLAERFRMVMRTESKDAAIMALVVATSGAKFEPRRRTLRRMSTCVSIRRTAACGGPFETCPCTGWKESCRAPTGTR
jgi:uncharacterized protein (TIGR03435 family)